MPTSARPGEQDFSTGLYLGMAVGVVFALPTFVASKSSGYQNDVMNAWLAILAGAYVVVLAAALILARRTIRQGVGLATGATLGFALAPLLLLIAIVMRSA